MKTHPLFEKRRIFAPGPTPVPEEVLSLLGRSPLHHRTKEFGEILTRVRENLKFLFQTQLPVYVLSASGTGAMEACVVNVLAPGDSVLVINAGKFGERWIKICNNFGIKTQALNVEWGQSVDPGIIQKQLKSNSGIKAVLFQASETSTGVAHPVGAISEAIRANSDALIMVDAITALGVSNLPMDGWGIDVVVSGSQKALMLPPGLAFLALSKRAIEARKRGGLPRFYFDLNAEDKVWATNETAWTPAVGLVVALDLVLLKIKEVGLQRIFDHHDRLAKATREAMTVLGLNLFAKMNPSPAVTAVHVPSQIADGKKIVSTLRDRFSITIAGGQDQWKGKMFRIGHLGFYDELDTITIIAAVEIVLKGLGFDCKLGQGVGCASSIFCGNE